MEILDSRVFYFSHDCITPATSSEHFVLPLYYFLLFCFQSRISWQEVNTFIFMITNNSAQMEFFCIFLTTAVLAEAKKKRMRCEFCLHYLGQLSCMLTWYLWLILCFSQVFMVLFFFPHVYSLFHNILSSGLFYGLHVCDLLLIILQLRRQIWHFSAQSIRTISHFVSIALFFGLHRTNC